MNKFINLAAAGASALFFGNLSIAQDTKVPPKDVKTEEIVIRKKSDKTEKMTIVVDGDNVTINGKPANDFKAADVTVTKRTGRIAPVPPIAPIAPGAPYMRSFRGPHNDVFKYNNGFTIPPAPNKALLGVLTEKTEDGIKIKEVTKESGAEKAGLQKDDIITKVGETKVTTPRELVEAINKYNPSDKVAITYKRNGKENKTTAELGENKNDVFMNGDDNDFNFEMPDGVAPHFEDFNFQFNRKPKIGLQIQDVEEGKGVTVKDVDDDSPAAKAGMKEGDIITQANGKDIAGVDDLRNLIRESKEGDTVKFSYKRDGKSETAEMKIPKRLKSADL